MNLVDSHCHLYYEPYASNLNDTIKKCKKENVNYLLSIGVDLETSKKNILISEKYNEVFCTIGLHPNNILEKKNELNEIFNLYQKDKKIIGIGEAGIDLYRSQNNLQEQVKYFCKQIEFAIDKKIPVIIHTRNADTETYEVLKNFKSDKFKFIIHSFTGTKDFAFKCIDLGGYISFNGILTFKKSQELRDICGNLPLDRILIETDSPYLSPEPNRGKTNHPVNVKFVAEIIAKITNTEYNRICSLTYNNFKKIFDLDSNEDS